MLLTLRAYFLFMWRIHHGLTLACLSVTIGLWWERAIFVACGLVSAQSELFPSWCCCFPKASAECKRSRGSPPNRTKSSGSSERMRKSRHNSEKYF